MGVFCLWAPEFSAVGLFCLFVFILNIVLYTEKSLSHSEYKIDFSFCQVKSLSARK